MYSALNEDYMFQEMHDRAVRMNARANAGASSGHPKEKNIPNRRWWRRAVRLAR